ncbi:MAG TPA: Rne/Rng family ribonuclease, partial [Jatrophihabitans sp.]|nr:Rne/Rng family ribonuclease [Jatrophihabitans sp.]
HAEEVAEAALSASARRRRRRRRSSAGDGAEAALSEDDPPNTVVHVRDSRAASRGSAADDDGVRGVKGSTRLEAKRQRRRDNRDTGRRRAPILTEAEFLARRESVDRVMAVRQAGDRTQIAVLEDDILVEHYVTRASASSAVGNVYLGRVQNVLPSMEAAFVDIGRGRNGVLYAGEVNWDVAGLEGKSRSIENALNAGDMVLVQVTKDPIGHKGARLTSQISLPGRFVVYVPGGGMTGISRKLPDVERSRLKAILKKVVPDEAGVIVRTAAEGASEQDLISDVERLKSEWESISTKSAKAKQSSEGPSLLHGEPDLAIRVVRDIFNDDFKKLVVAGAEIHRTINDYVRDIAPDLADRISRHTGESDLFRDLRVDEQLAKALDRKVWLPSGGSLVIDRTEAMTVVDVNTGKYTGSGGNLEQTVTRNNLEAAEEIVRQLRLRDIGGIVVIDFIDMVLESNRDLVLRRLTECLGRDRTKHQVAEVTSLGLVQMTRKRVGEGLLEAFSEPCSVCNGRGVIVHLDGMDRRSNGASPSATSSSGPAAEEDRPARGRRSRKATKAEQPAVAQPDPAEIAAEAEKRRVAASAVAAIAAATGHHDDAGSRPAAGSHPANPAGEGSEPAPAEPSAWGTAQPGTAQSGPAEAGTAEAGRTETGPAQPSPVDPSPVEPSPAEPGRTGRGRAARGRSRADRDRTDQDGVAKNRPERGVGDSSTPAQPPPAATTEPAPAAATEPAPVATQPPPAAPEVGAGQSGAAQPVRPRRRRAASRPAGPPVPVNAVDG